MNALDTWTVVGLLLLAMSVTGLICACWGYGKGRADVHKEMSRELRRQFDIRSTR